MKTTAYLFKTVLLATLLPVLGACSGDVWLEEAAVDINAATKSDGVGEVWDGTADTGWYNSTDKEFEISTAKQLAGLAKLVNDGNTFSGKTVKLTADIVLNDTEDWENWNTNTPKNTWTPIGLISDCSFKGSFDGQGYVVSGIYINNNDKSKYFGLFGSAQNATIKNVGVINGYINSTCTIGGVVGWNYKSKVLNCYNSSTIIGAGTYVGGIVGQNQSISGAKLENCFNIGKVGGTSNNIGGISGISSKDYLFNCYWLEGSCNKGVGGTLNGNENAIKMTASQFVSGEVAYLLQGEQTTLVWGQTIGTDTYPVPTTEEAKRIYTYQIYNGTDKAETGYANDGGPVLLPEGTNAIALVDGFTPATDAENVVVKDDNDDYTCASFVLADGKDFYTPVAFTAEKASYSRTPAVWADGKNGWETICLPFSGTLHADGKTKQPVVLDTNSGEYWLRSLTGFTAPNTLMFTSPGTLDGNMIVAGKPYIIALPGPSFGDDSLLGQPITVVGEQVMVMETAPEQAEASGWTFAGTFAKKACDFSSYLLNSENGSIDVQGNQFVRVDKESSLKPFRCFVSVTSLNVGCLSTRSADGLPKQLYIGQ